MVIATLPLAATMASVRINGEDVTIGDVTVSSYLSSHGYDLSRTAVLLNGKVVPRSSIESTRIKDGDVLEIVSFVGGG